MSACDDCLRRAWLIAALAGNLEFAWRARTPLRDILALGDEQLIKALAGKGQRVLADRHESLDTAAQLTEGRDVA